MSGQTLLVIDDVEENREILRYRLEKQGYKIEMAGDGQEGLMLMSKKPVDLVLLDLNMPVMNGFTFLEKVKSNQNLTDIPVIVVTSFDDDETANDVLTFGACGFVSKPYDMEQVNHQIKSCLRSPVSCTS
ncbi:MAG: response regulator [Gammaproteobacteria bacterium]